MQLTSVTNHISQRLIGGLTSAQDRINESVYKLSTGKRLSTFAEGAIDLSRIEYASSRILSLNAANSNIINAKNDLDLADIALIEISDLLARLKELSIQAATATITSAERDAVISEASSLRGEIDSLARYTETGNIKLVDGSYTAKGIQVGDQPSDTFYINLRSALPSVLGSFNSTGPTRGALTAAQTPAANTTSGSEDIVLTSRGSSVTIDVAANDSARAVATKVNALTSSTNVRAEAVTFAHLFSTNASSANYTISINSTNTSSFSISDSDVSDAVAKINLISATTGVSATATTDNKVLLLDDTGADITIENAAAGTDLDVQAVTSNGETTQGNAISLAAGASSNNDATRVIGTLQLNSHEAFSVSQSGDTSLAYATTETATLSSVETIDLSSSVTSSQSQDIIGDAIEQVLFIRGAVGAYLSRLNFADSHLNSELDQIEAYRSSLEDTDFAIESAELSKAMILQEVNTALLAQTVGSHKLVLKLIDNAA